MNLFMPSGQQKGVQYADGLKIGITIKLSSATGNVDFFARNLNPPVVFNFYASICGLGSSVLSNHDC